MSFDQIMAEIERICRKEKVKSLSLFGSYAKGTETPGSDIDIVVSGVSDSDHLAEELNQIDTLKKIDIFFEDEIQDPILKGEIKKYGKKIYG